MNLPSALNAFHFLRPAWLMALLPLWLLAAWLAQRRSRDGNWSRIIDAELLPALRLDGGSGSGGLSPWPWLALAWSLAVLALAGPSWQRDETAAWRAPAATVLVLDLSPSMATTDLAPNRYTRARYAIEQLLDAAHDTRVGLVVFSDEPYTVAPLTDDVATLRSLLEPLAPAIMPSPGNNLAPALDSARRLLAGAATADRRIVVLTDGFADPAVAFTSAAKLAASGIVVDVVGIGTANGAPVTDASGGFVRNAQGRPALAHLDPEPLQQLARSGGGKYADLAGLPALIDSFRARPAFGDTASAAKDVTISSWRDTGAWLLPGLLLIAALLSRRGWL